MKNFNLILFASLLILLFSGNVQAAFTDDFNDPAYTNWNIVSGTWTDSGSMQAVVAGSIFRTIGYDRNPNYIAVTINRTGSVAGTDTIAFYQDSSGKICELQFTPSTGVLSGFAAVGVAACPVVPSVTIKLNNQFRVESTIQSSNSITYTVTNITSGNNTVVTTSLVSGNPFNGGVTDADRIVIQDTTLSYSLLHLVVSNASSISSTQINWANTEITQGVNAPFTWSISSTDWSTWSCGIFGILPCSWRVDEEFNNGQTDTTSTLITVGQSGTYSQYMQNPGTYTLKLIKSATFIDDEVATSSMIVNPQTSSYFNMPQSVYIKTNVTVTWHIGIGGTPTLLEWYYLDNGVEVKEDRVVLTDGVTTTLDGTTNISFARVGFYNVYLKTGSVNSQILAPIQTITTSSLGGGKPSNNFSVSDIVLIGNNGSGGSGGKYYFNNLIDGNYSIDAANFSHNGEFYIDVRNINSSAVTLQYTGSGDTTVGINDAGTFGLVINNKPDVGLSGYWLPGDNQIRLMARYSNGTSAVLSYDTFSLSNVDESGYGLIVSPLNVIADQQVQITVTSPTTGAYITIQGNGVGITNYFKTYNFSIGTKTISTSFQKQGSYEILLYDVAGGIHQSARVTVATSATPTPTATESINQQTSAISDLLGSNIFWALMFTAGFMVMVAFATSQKKEQ